MKPYEGLRLEAYRCPAGVWTIGYGHTSAAGTPEVYPGMTITEDQANKILENDVENFWAQIRPLIKVSLNDNEIGSIISLVFNIGLGAFKTSTCLKRLNAKNKEGAAEALTWWNKATVDGKKVTLRGLVRRRNAEREWFLTPTSGSEPLPEDSRTQPQSEEMKSLTKSRTNQLSLAGLVTAVTGYLGNLPPELLVIAIVAIFAAFIINRWLERRRGEH